MSVAAAVKDLSTTFMGQLLQPTDVGYDDVGLQLSHQLDQVPAIIRVPNHLKIGITLEQSTQAAPQHGMVVSQNDTNHEISPIAGTGR